MNVTVELYGLSERLMCSRRFMNFESVRVLFDDLIRKDDT